MGGLAPLAVDASGAAPAAPAAPATIDPESIPQIDADTSHVEQIRRRGFLWVRCFPQQISPFLAVDISQGAMPGIAGPERFRGVDVDVLEKVAAHLGVELRFHPGSEPTISSSFSAVEDGYGDLVAGGLTITESRLKRFDFSAPYFRFYDLLLGSRALTDADAPALTEGSLAVMPGSSYDEKTRALGLENRVTHFEFIGEAYESVAAGDHDFSFADSTMMNEEQLFGVKVLYRLGDKQGYGYVLPKGSDLKATIDQVLTGLRESGELQEILDRYGSEGQTDMETLPQIPWARLTR